MTLEAYLREQNVPFETLVHPAMYTAQGLAAEEHVPGMSVAKPVVVKAGDRFVMCVLPACCRVDLDRVAELLHVERAELASESEMARLFGDCELGAEPPFGGLYGLSMLMDESLRGSEQIVFQAGSHTRAIKMNRSDYERLTQPQVASFAHHL